MIVNCLIALQFSRTVASDTSKGPALIAFMQHSKWRKIAILSSTESVWFETRLGLRQQLDAASVKVLTPAAFEPGHVKDMMLSEVRQSGIRIVLVLSYGNDTNRVASLASRDAMSAGWAWLVTYDDEMASADMQSWLYFRPFLASEGMQAFAEQVSAYSKSHFNIELIPDSVDLPYSAALHDAIVLYANAARTVLSRGHHLHDGQAVTEALRNTTFKGVGGIEVALNARGDRIESYKVMNYVLEANGTLGSVLVGVYNCTLEQYEAYKAVVWPGNTTEVPADYFSGAPLPGHASRSTH